MDLDSGELEEIAAENGRDLLQPRRTTDGALYFIRKPYQSTVPQTSLLGSLRDTALFPYRMGRAIFQYFNVFSMMYTGKPLVSKQGAAQRRMDPRQMFIYGNLAMAQMAQSAEDEAQSLVPASWELVRRAAGASDEIVVKGVLAFDVAEDGGILYSDGASITRIDAQGRSTRVLRGESIEQVVAL